MAADKSKHILELERRLVQMRALQLIDYSSKFLDLIPHPQIEGGKAYYIASITNEPAEEDKRGILPNEIEPSKAVQQIVKLDKIKVFRDVINEEIMSLSLDRVKEFTEDITAGMFAKFATLIDKEIIAKLSDTDTYNDDSIVKNEIGEKKWKKEEWNKEKVTVDYAGKIIDGVLDNIDLLLNPSDKNNKAEVEASSKDEGSIIWLVRTDLYNFIRRKFLTTMNQPKYGDFTQNLRAVVRCPELDNDLAYVLFDYRKIAVPYNIKDYSEWYYGLDKCTYLRLKVGYGLETLDSIPAIAQSMVVPTA